MTELIFEDISLLITHYNRSASLEHLLKTLKDKGLRFAETVVSDDGSRPEHIDKLTKLQEIYLFNLVLAPINQGLGNNINKGQEVIKTPYTLYIQEDFVPKTLFREKLKNAVDFMDNWPELDMVRFYAYFKYPYLKPYKNGFSQMIYNAFPYYIRYRKFYLYSDHPHLRRSNFLEKFGKYKEGANVDVTEYQMMMKVIQRRGKALFYDDYQGLFEQENTIEEPSTITRTNLRESKNFLVTFIRHCYRHFKFNFDYHFSKYL